MPSVRLEGWIGDQADVQRDPREYAQAGNIALIPVVGELVHRGASMDAMSGLTSYDAIADMTQCALSDPSVSGVIFDIDSPGGEADGCFNFAEWLASQRGIKPMLACVNEIACSAAYAIASAADKIVISPTGEAGSIGVVAYHTDLSAAMEKAGVVVTYVYAGSHKIDGVSTLPLSDDAKAAWQVAIDTVYGRFCNLVAANRGLSVESVRATEARIYMGQAAVDVGLADAIGTREDVVMSIQNQQTRVATAGSRLASFSPLAAGKTDPVVAPTTPTDTPASVPAQPVQQPDNQPPHTEPGADPVDAPDEQKPNSPASPGFGPAAAVTVATMCESAGFVNLIPSLLRTGASVERVKVRIAEAAEITEAATKAGMPHMGPVLIQSGIGVEDARKVIFTASAGAADANSVSTARAAQQSSSIDTSEIYKRYNALPAQQARI